MSQYVNVNTVAESNGALDVFIGNGQPLVLGDAAQQLTTTADPYDASSLNISLVGSGGATSNITSEISGGTLGGLLAAKTQILDPAQNALGLISVGLSTLVNQQQESGMDLTGAQGQAMFSVGAVETLPDASNTGSSTLAVTRTNLGALTSDDYQLQYSGGAWQLSDTTTGRAVTMTGTGTSTDPFQAAGISIAVSGTPANGDSYLIRPTAGATAGLAVQLTNPAQIAAASLVQAAAGTGNTGTGQVSAAGVTDPSTYTPGTYTIAFTSSTAYQVKNGAGTVVSSGTYASGTPITFNGAQVTLTGTPANGDTFTVSPNSAANSGDNSNMFAMIDALSSSALVGGSTSLSGAANNLVSQIGVVTQQAQANASAQQTVNQSAVDARSNVSGVNLDEEAANMLQYQQAYQACAQMIQTSSTVFNSLITAITDG